MGIGLPDKAVLGKTLLSGATFAEKARNALVDAAAIHMGGLAGVVVKAHHCTPKDLRRFLDESVADIRFPGFFVGINTMLQDYVETFELAVRYKLDFVQLEDAGEGRKFYERFDNEAYAAARRSTPVIGTVWPWHYQQPGLFSRALLLAESRSDAVSLTYKQGWHVQPTDLATAVAELPGMKIGQGSSVNAQNIARILGEADFVIVNSALRESGNAKTNVSVSYAQRIAEAAKQYSNAA